MIRRKRILKEPLQSDQDFFKFLKRIREESGVSEEELAEGLMDVSMLSRIERGQRPVCKTMRNRLLGRLGVTPDMYENLLGIEDYETYKRQYDILCAVDQNEFQKAVHLIKSYEGQEPLDDKIKNQFCLVMKAEILKTQGADRTEISACYETAVRLTVPEVEQVYTGDKILSVLEVNIILEYEYYGARYKAVSAESTEEFSAKCRYLMDYVENALYDELSLAKIYPKIAVYHMEVIFPDGCEMNPAKLRSSLKVCSRAIEMLRDTGRAFYLTELLEYKRRILTELIRECKEGGNIQEQKDYEASLMESGELEELLKKLYTQYDVPVYMNSCTYLYYQRWVFSIGDVLRIRRNMLGLTQEEVCDGICSVKSLRRAEKKQVNMQREPLGKILRRLGLSKEIQKTALVTNDRKALYLNNELSVCCNNRDIEKARKLLKNLKSRICLKIPENLQRILEFEVSLDLMENKITEEEFVVREEETLRCTLKAQRIFAAEEVYLTETEMSCVCRKMQKLGEREKREIIDFLLHFFEQYEKKYMLSEYISMYEFVVACATNELSSMGEYQLATSLDKKALRQVLSCRRLCAINEFLYDILWSDMQQNIIVGQQTEKEKMTEGLKQCIVISHFCKYTFYEQIYLDKLHQLTQNSFDGVSLHGAINSSSE